MGCGVFEDFGADHTVFRERERSINGRGDQRKLTANQLLMKGEGS